MTPVYIKLLRLALKDEYLETRLIASKALSKTEEKMNDDILSSLQDVKNEPKLSEARNRLGKVYFKYATLGLLDETTQKYYLQKAVNEFIVSLQHDPTQEDILILLGKTLLMIQNYHQAKEIFKKIIELHPLKIKPRLLLCEAYCGLKDFDSIEKEAQYICEHLKMSRKRRDLIEYWAQGSGDERKASMNDFLVSQKSFID